jgi:hypothetical protein
LLRAAPAVTETRPLTAPQVRVLFVRSHAALVAATLTRRARETIGTPARTGKKAS